MDATSAKPSHDLSTFPAGLKGKRILLCTESFGPVNGVSRTNLMLVNHLRANGANVAVVAPHNSTKVNTFVPTVAAGSAVGKQAAPGGKETTPLLPQHNPEIRIHGWPLPYNPELSVVYPVRLSALYERTFGGPPDLIYVASPASLGYQVLLQLRQQPETNRVPAIANFQTDLATYCGILFPAPFGAVATCTFAMVEGFLFRHPSVKTLFYPSRYVRRYLEKNGVDRSKMQILRRGVNTELFHPNRRSESQRNTLAPNGEIILICVARLAGEKGLEFLAHAARELDRRGLHFKLHIVGGNRNAAVEEEIKGLFSDLEATGKVLFAGFKLGEDLAEAYASADIFLHCSITETFGLVVLESLASGVPVVARNEGGPSDIIEDGKTGYLTPEKDLHSFVDRVLGLAANEKLRLHMGLNARSQACEATWTKINNKVAWRMLECIEEREQQQATLQLQDEERRAGSSSRPFALGWTGPHNALASSSWTERIVNARLVVGLVVILGFWGIVGLYLVFIQAALFLKRLFRV